MDGVAQAVRGSEVGEVEVGVGERFREIRYMKHDRRTMRYEHLIVSD